MDVKCYRQKEGKEGKLDDQSCWTAVVSVYSEIALHVVLTGAKYKHFFILSLFPGCSPHASSFSREQHNFGMGLKHAWIFKRDHDWAPLWQPHPVAPGQASPDQQEILGTYPDTYTMSVVFLHSLCVCRKSPTLPD